MNEIEDIKNRLDIVEFIGGYLQLKKAGANYKANCPFHAEKTASFMVSPEKQIWHCFGCDEGGDVVGFFMKIENLDFSDALEQLADKTGVKLARGSGIPKESKTKLFRLQELAAQFFKAILWEKPQGKTALKYLRDRGLADETIKDFCLGFAPEMIDGLTGILTKKGFSAKEIVDAGLGILEKNGNARDRFRGRVMFPIWDTQNRIIAFTGRILEDKSNLSKYVNSPETPIYYKSAVVYGLNKAKSAILEKDSVVVVEGQMDVIFSHQAGVINCVAVSGTAATEQHLRTLRRYTKNQYFCFDEDPAGQKAAERVLDLASGMDIFSKVVKLPFGKDAADVVKKDPAAWQAAVEKPWDLSDYYFSRVSDIIKGNDESARRAAISFMVAKINLISDPVIRSDWVSKLSQKVGVNGKAIWDQLSDKKNRGSYFSPVSKKIDPVDMLEKELLTLLLIEPEHISYVKTKITTSDISEPNRKYFEGMLIEEKFEKEKFLSIFPREEKNVLLQLTFKEEQSLSERRIAEDIAIIVQRMLKKNRVLKISEIRKQIQAAESAKDFDLLKDLTKRFQSLASMKV